MQLQFVGSRFVESRRNFETLANVMKLDSVSISPSTLDIQEVPYIGNQCANIGYTRNITVDYVGCNFFMEKLNINGQIQLVPFPS